MFKKILVTGSSGTIGTRLCEKLLELGYDVVGVDSRENEWNQKVNSITKVGSLLDRKFVDSLPRSELIIHLAAHARVYDLVVNPELAKENFEIIFNVLEFARKSAVKGFIFSSSREVYGNSEKIIHSEDDALVKNCESPYTASKIGGEALVHSYNQCYGLGYIIFRFSNVYGMYDNSNRVVPLFIRLVKSGQDLIVYGKEKLLDFTYIDDCVSGIMSSIQNFGKVKNNTFNLASGFGTSILEVAQLIKTLLNGKNKIILKDPRTGEVIRYIADISKAKKVLGYDPQTTIVEGVKKAIEWHNTWVNGGSKK
ncbi:MAG TPA: NAD-dependent epimerase/dehydratase family protein [archaeon]|nr:NAD-dependent epimerase/dehydratase family protein [archaeon]